MKILRRKIVIAFLIVGLTHSAFAATGEMGTGIPQFGIYSAATGVQTLVWSLSNATIPMASGCSRLVLEPTTMGMDTYKLAVATMMAAKLSGKQVKFYAHDVYDGGCGVDYIEMMN
jgi:hypothetical protein